MSQWQETTLGDSADWLSGGTPFKGNSAFWSGTIPWVSAKDMKAFRLHDAEITFQQRLSVEVESSPIRNCVVVGSWDDSPQRCAYLRDHAEWLLTKTSKPFVQSPAWNTSFWPTGFLQISPRCYLRLTTLDTALVG